MITEKCTNNQAKPEKVQYGRKYLPNGVFENDQSARDSSSEVATHFPSRCL